MFAAERSVRLSHLQTPLSSRLPLPGCPETTLPAFAPLRYHLAAWTGLDGSVQIRAQTRAACTLLTGGSGMTTYDAAMVIVGVLGMVRGAWRGFTWQMASIASLVLGYTTAHTTSARIASYLPGEPEMQRMLAMGVIYIAVSGGIFGIAWMIRGTLRKLRFEAYDRHLGMLLGGFEGVGVGMLATMFVVSLAPATRQPIFSSTTGHVVGTVMNNLGPVLPGEVRKVLAPHWDGSFSQAVAAHDANEESSGTDDLGSASSGIGTSSQLPALHEADA